MSHDAGTLYFHLIFAATSFYLQQHFMFAAAFIFTATFVSAETFIFGAQTFFICCDILFNLQQVSFKIAATFKIAACPLWAAVVYIIGSAL